MRVSKCFNSPRMNTATSRCGACGTPRGPATQPGLMVVKRNTPFSSVAHAPETFEARRQRLVLRVIGMGIFSVRVCLPDFEDGIVDGLAVAVDNAAVDRDLFARAADGARSVT